LDRQIGRRECWRQRRGFPRSALAELQEGSIPADADARGVVRFGVDADVNQRVVRGGLCLLDRVLESAMMAIAAVELADEVEPLALAARDFVEVLLHLG